MGKMTGCKGVVVQWVNNLETLGDEMKSWRRKRRERWRWRRDGDARRRFDWRRRLTWNMFGLNILLCTYFLVD